MSFFLLALVLYTPSEKYEKSWYEHMKVWKLVFKCGSKSPVNKNMDKLHEGSTLEEDLVSLQGGDLTQCLCHGETLSSHILQ